MADDGWTTVANHRGKRGQQPTKFSPGATAALDTEVTAESIGSEFSKARTRWSNTSARPEVHRILTRLCTTDEPPLQTAVCLAVGSFSRMNLENRRRSLAQLAVFVDTVKHMQHCDMIAINMYAQDPAFSAVDKEFLSRIDMTVLDVNTDSTNLGPAEPHFGPHTFVADFFMNHDEHSLTKLLESQNRLILSALLGHVVKLQSIPTLEEVGRRLKDRLDQQHARYDFPTNAGELDQSYMGLQWIGRLRHLEM